VDAAVHKALEKLPADRFASAAQFAEALANPAFAALPATAAREAAPAPAAPRLAKLAALATRISPWVVAAAGVGFGAWAMRNGRAPDIAPVVTRYAITLPDSAAYFEQVGTSIAYARDGSAFAYTGSGGRAGIYVRYADRVDPVAVAGERNGVLPFFSPDGRWLGYREGARLMKAPLAGGVPVVICDSCEGYAFEWGPDDTIRYNQAVTATSPLRRLMAIGAGRPRAGAGTPDSASLETYRFRRCCPMAGRCCSRSYPRHRPARGARPRLRADHAVRAAPGATRTTWIRVRGAGQRDGSLVAVPFDLRRLDVPARPVTIVSDAIVDAVGTSGRRLRGRTDRLRPARVGEQPQPDDGRPTEAHGHRWPTEGFAGPGSRLMGAGWRSASEAGAARTCGPST
jgi:serine/threonine-protein kinase